MRKNRAGRFGLVLGLVLAPSLLVASSSLAQVVSPVENKDPALRWLQQEYMDDLTRADDSCSTVAQFFVPGQLSGAWGSKHRNRERKSVDSRPPSCPFLTPLIFRRAQDASSRGILAHIPLLPS